MFIMLQEEIQEKKKVTENWCVCVCARSLNWAEMYENDENK